ncbi:MAG TPA: transposase family protein [Ktedonobacteraceae bacterium]|nr:transposase family protein [Ktedonobacteraceae bacterium]
MEHINRTGTILCVHIISTQRVSHCPRCAQASHQIHSHYQRVVADVPCGSQQVRLLLTARKFFCGTPTCPRKRSRESVCSLMNLLP